MVLGFFMYISGEYRTIGVGVAVVGAVCEFLGFFLAYLGYRSTVQRL